jgi:hypothetical protein
VLAFAVVFMLMADDCTSFAGMANELLSPGDPYDSAALGSPERVEKTRLRDLAWSPLNLAGGDAADRRNIDKALADGQPWPQLYHDKAVLQVIAGEDFTDIMLTRGLALTANPGGDKKDSVELQGYLASLTSAFDVLTANGSTNTVSYKRVQKEYCDQKAYAFKTFGKDFDYPQKNSIRCP